MHSYANSKTTMSTRPSLDDALGSLGLSLEALSRCADSIVVFGSSALGVSGPGSDYDLLLVGPGKTQRTRWVDLVWVNPRRAINSEWLGSELAQHVARYGRLLSGSFDWRMDVPVSQAAIEAKADRVTNRASVLAKYSPQLTLGQRAKHTILLRRDVQRLRCLIRGVPVPPSQILDRSWINDGGETLLDGLDRIVAVDTQDMLRRLFTRHSTERTSAG